MQKFNPDHYKFGSDRYVRFGEDYLDNDYAHVQKEILRAVADNQRVLIISGNGPGKTYSMASCILGFLYTNPDSIVMGTSGSYTQFVDTLWRPLETMHDKLKAKGLPGRTLGGRSPELEIDDEWFAKVVSPRDPSELEGRHGNAVMVVIEESDKPYITEEHFDSANSSITDANDRLVAIANPPEDETDVVIEKKKSDRWTVLEFASFESRNVLVDAGEKHAERLPGIVDLPTIADDWEEWNGEPWPEKPHWCPPVTDLKDRHDKGDISHEEVCQLLRPGFETVRTAHEERDDLDTRWYRRRAGITPRQSASVHRPIYAEQVESSYVPNYDDDQMVPIAAGLDVARQGGDWNCLTYLYPECVSVVERWKGVDHNQNEAKVRTYMSRVPDNLPLVVDAQGEGSGLADRLLQIHPGTKRFNAGSEPRERKKYYNCWSEGTDVFGKFLRDGGMITGKRLREEALSIAHSVQFEEKYYSSRNSEVLKATSKSNVKDHLGRSPDVFDSAYMAVWAVKAKQPRQLTW